MSLIGYLVVDPPGPHLKTTEMESLIAKGNNVAPLKRKRSMHDGKAGGTSSSGFKSHSKNFTPGSSSSSDPQHVKSSSGAKKSDADATLLSVSRSVRSSASGPASKSSANRHIKDLKLRAHLNSLDAHAKESRGLAKDTSDLLLNATSADAGFMAAEDVMERTWRIDQDYIVKNAGAAVAGQRKEWLLDGGPYRSRYTRNGRCVLSISLLSCPPELDEL